MVLQSRRGLMMVMICVRLCAMDLAGYRHNTYFTRCPIALHVALEYSDHY